MAVSTAEQRLCPDFGSIMEGMEDKMKHLVTTATSKRLKIVIMAVQDAAEKLAILLDASDEDDARLIEGYLVPRKLYDAFTDHIYAVIRKKCEKRINFGRVKKEMNRSQIWGLFKGYLFHNAPKEFSSSLWVPLLQDIHVYFRRIAIRYGGNNCKNYDQSVIERVLNTAFMKNIFEVKCQINSQSNPSGPVIQHACWKLSGLQRVLHQYFDKTYAAHWKDWLDTRMNGKKMRITSIIQQMVKPHAQKQWKNVCAMNDIDLELTEFSINMKDVQSMDLNQYLRDDEAYVLDMNRYRDRNDREDEDDDDHAEQQAVDRDAEETEDEETNHEEEQKSVSDQTFQSHLSMNSALSANTLNPPMPAYTAYTAYGENSNNSVIQPSTAHTPMYGNEDKEYRPGYNLSYTAYRGVSHHHSEYRSRPYPVHAPQRTQRYPTVTPLMHTKCLLCRKCRHHCICYSRLRPPSANIADHDTVPTLPPIHPQSINPPAAPLPFQFNLESANNGNVSSPNLNAPITASVSNESRTDTMHDVNVMDGTIPYEESTETMYTYPVNPSMATSYPLHLHQPAALDYAYAAPPEPVYSAADHMAFSNMKLPTYPYGAAAGFFPRFPSNNHHDHDFSTISMHTSNTNASQPVYEIDRPFDGEFGQYFPPK
eukprot:CAMPEP_0197024614 /NCGR_PEP_ID=MMETSP1384-20130603/5127_1 /TAXON_ID=29189 /ORGANISM="Ammonia sp." /LENGTH=650 /DNA_ID=CAMNT_0042453025 /DNA_START=28 /DNA_END=1980 /DNA_ORIENTATION=-